MTLLGLIIALVVVGIIMYLINSFVPMDGNIKRLLNIAVIVVLVLWLLSIFGLLGALDIPVGVRR